MVLAIYACHGAHPIKPLLQSIRLGRADRAWWSARILKWPLHQANRATPMKAAGPTTARGGKKLQPRFVRRTRGFTRIRQSAAGRKEVLRSRRPNCFQKGRCGPRRQIVRNLNAESQPI